MKHRRSASTVAGTFVVPIAILILAGCAQSTILVDPHQPGWERVFTVDWEAGEYRGQPTVKGYLQNVSPYPVWRIQLLVDALDGSGKIIAQKGAWLAGDEMEPFSRRYFEVPVPEVASQYRVRVYSYDRSEAPDGGGSSPGPR